MEGGTGEHGTAPGADEGVATVGEKPPARRRAWYLLLLLPFAGLLIVPLYAHDKPELFGFPFFYWYQFAWVPVTALITWLVSLRVSRR
jgi:hypothetical protein